MYNYEKIINSMNHIIDHNGPLVIEFGGQVSLVNCLTIKEKHISKVAEQFHQYDFNEIIQTTDRSFLIK